MPNRFTVVIENVHRVCETPNKCPICHHTVTIGGPANQNIIGRQAQIVYICPNDECRNLFIAFYELQQGQNMKLVAMKPSKVEMERTPDVVKAISPSFMSIYQEASDAKALGLMQIAGPGYRKAFEFLIKDYAKHKEIEESFSGNVIKNFIGDIRIQKVGKRALWLGNDETHYLREWKDHDIEDLITLIKPTLNWIEIEQLSEDYTNEIPDRKESKPTGAGV